jgi:hypothetical protein
MLVPVGKHVLVDGCESSETYNGDLVPDDLNLWPAKVFEGNDRR